MREESLSPYALSDGNFIIYDAIIADPGDYLNGIENKITEKAILNALYKYGVLTKHCLKKALNLKKEDIKRDISNTLRQMVCDGAVVTYERREEGRATVLYMLQEKLREEMETKSHNRQKMPVEKKLPDILMRASLNQWHIGIQEAYKDRILEERYFSRRKWSYQKGYFLSFIKIKTEKYPMIITALPYAKTERGFRKTAAYLAKLSLCVGSVKSQKTAVVITVESLKQMEEAYKKILAVKELSLIEPFFVLDINTKAENTICWLYSCEIEGGIFYYDTYHLDDLMAATALS